LHHDLEEIFQRDLTAAVVKASMGDISISLKTKIDLTVISLRLWQFKLGCHQRCDCIQYKKMQTAHKLTNLLNKITA